MAIPEPGQPAGRGGDLDWGGGLHSTEGAFHLLSGPLLATLNAREPAGTEPSVTSFSVSHTFTDLGTHEEKPREIDGVTIIYPVDEEDVINLLLPKLVEFRKKRSIQAPLEAKVLREGIAAFEVRKKVLDRVRNILGVKTLSGDIDAIYDKALKDIDSLCEQWSQWSGDIGTLHLFNHATVKPYRNGSTQVHFFGVSPSRSNF